METHFNSNSTTEISPEEHVYSISGPKLMNYCYETSVLEMFQMYSLSNLMQNYAITLTLPHAIQ